MIRLEWDEQLQRELSFELRTLQDLSAPNLEAHCVCV